MKQITIISEDRPGIMAQVSEALASAGINIDSFDAETIENSAIMILTVDQYDHALKILQRIPNIKAITEDAILIRLKDEPGALAQISRRFSDAGISLRSVRIVQRDRDFSIVAISTARTEDAMGLVSDVLVS